MAEIVKNAYRSLHQIVYFLQHYPNPFTTPSVTKLKKAIYISFYNQQVSRKTTLIIYHFFGNLSQLYKVFFYNFVFHNCIWSKLSNMKAWQIL